MLQWFSQALRKHGQWEIFFAKEQRAREETGGMREWPEFYQLRAVVEAWLHSHGRTYLKNYCDRRGDSENEGASDLADELLRRLHFYYLGQAADSLKPDRSAQRESQEEGAASPEANFYLRLSSKAREHNRSIIHQPRPNTGPAKELLTKDCNDASEPKFHCRPERDVSLADGDSLVPGLNCWADELPKDYPEYNQMLQRPVDIFSSDVPNPERRKGTISKAARQKFRAYVHRIVAYSTPRYWWPTELVLGVWKSGIYRQGIRTRVSYSDTEIEKPATKVADVFELQCSDYDVSLLMNAIKQLYRASEGETLKRLKRNIAAFLRTFLRNELELGAHDDFLEYSYRTLTRVSVKDPSPADQFIMSLRLKVNRERFGGEDGDQRFMDDYKSCLPVLASRLWTLRFEFFPGLRNSSTPSD